jgi:hypothetical protein
MLVPLGRIPAPPLSVYPMLCAAAFFMVRTLMIRGPAILILVLLSVWMTVLALRWVGMRLLPRAVPRDRPSIWFVVAACVLGGLTGHSVNLLGGWTLALAGLAMAASAGLWALSERRQR